MTDFIRYGRNDPFVRNDRINRLTQPTWVDGKSAPCEPTDRDGIGAVWGDIDLSEIGAVCEAPEWHLYCTINCYYSRVSENGNATQLMEYVDPDGLCHVGSVTDEIEAVKFFSGHVKQFGDDHRPFMYMLPKSVMFFSQWLQQCYGDPLSGMRIGDYGNYIHKNQDIVRMYMAEIETTSIFRVPVDHRR